MKSYGQIAYETWATKMGNVAVSYSMLDAESVRAWEAAALAVWKAIAAQDQGYAIEEFSA